MAINLYSYQVEAVEKLKSGSILCGGVGSGKSRTAIAYFFFKICGGKIKVNGKGTTVKPKFPCELVIITTAKKRDSLEWEGECSSFSLSKDPKSSIAGIKIIIDSWNNIKKYKDREGSFFIFDEQRIVGSGTWVKSFLKISKKNKWILLSATPGDSWIEYVPVMIANGYYKNRSNFIEQHVIYSRFCKFPKIERYVGERKLTRIRDEIMIIMKHERPTVSHKKVIICDYDKKRFDRVMKERWNIFKNQPIVNAGELCYVLRKVVNSSSSRAIKVAKIVEVHPKVIIFYNFDYELDILRVIGNTIGVETKEWNGHKHEAIPKTDSWIYLVQYAASEGWNCIETNCVIFYSMNYSYKTMVQASGRIDRVNTSFIDLYYYHLRSNSLIDISIDKAIKKKKNFNISAFSKNVLA